MVSKRLVSPEKLEFFQSAILSFYERAGRVLPWRETTDVYNVLVSELMLQQTQVDRVVPKYLAFLERFPSASSLSEASLADVLRLWQGLGYNRRAKYLWQAAAFLAENPRPSYDELLALKGVGPYTAAAVCSFAYNEPVGAVDTNVHRVFDRFLGSVSDEFIEQAVPAGRSRDWHNALMDFGSLVCTKKSPSCSSCPLSDDCQALAKNSFDQEPTKSQKRFPGSVRWHRGRILRASLAGSVPTDALFSSLDSELRDEDKFSLALEQLVSEGLVSFEDGFVRSV